MFEILFQYPAVAARHRSGPFAEARERFVNHCASQGLSRATLQHYAQELLVVAERIDIASGEVIGSSAIEAAADRWAREQHQHHRTHGLRWSRELFIQTARTTLASSDGSVDGKIKISIRRHREDIGHPWILPDADLASTAQSTLAARHFTQRGLLFEARIDRSHTYRHKAAAVQPSPFATDHIVGMKIPECYRPEEIALERSGPRDQLRELLARSTS